MQINILDARNRLSQLIKAVQAGEEVVIANRGEPVARLVPIQPPLDAGSPERVLDWLARHPAPQVRNADDIDAAIAAEREAWD